MSKQVFIIRDQQQRYLDTQGQWSAGDGTEPPFFTPHRDVALNRLFELTLADAALRGKVETCPADDRGKPLLDAEATVTDDDCEPADAGTDAPGDTPSQAAGQA